MDRLSCVGVGLELPNLVGGAPLREGKMEEVRHRKHLLLISYGFWETSPGTHLVLSWEVTCETG
jgi:hypothetical protein